MVTLQSKTQRRGRALLAGAAACLLLWQALIFAFSADGRVIFSSGDVGASVVVAGEVCDPRTEHGGQTPAHSSHHHCSLCVIGDRDLALHASVVAASIPAVRAPRADDAPAYFRREGLAPAPLGWATSWSSRAPPSIS